MNDKETTVEHPQSFWGKTSPSRLDEKLLRGIQHPISDLWFLISITAEFIRAFHRLHAIGPCITVFGSARFDHENHYYGLAREIGRLIAEAGFTTMTGGGPGIMEGANRGAKEAGGKSIGCNIKLPKEQRPNIYVDLWFEFNHFFVRKVMLAKYSYAFIALPGGLGTMDEVMEVATLVQTKKMKNFPIVFIGTKYWGPLVDFMHNTLLKNKTIDKEDLELFLITDSPQAAMEHVKRYVIKEFSDQ